MTRTKWHDLSPRRRRVMIAGAAIESALKAAALADLARRPATEVNGSKTLWALAITLINAAGTVPIAYFVYGRRPSS